MKNKIILLIAVSLLLVSCFKDEGNYTYHKLAPPEWLFDSENSHINVYTRLGDTAVFKSSDMYTWGKDSLKREKEVTFKWVFNDVVVGTKNDFKIPADSIIIKMGLDKAPQNFIIGNFYVIDKETGIQYIVRAKLDIAPKYGNWDWIVLSEKGANSKLSAIKRKKKVVEGRNTYYYELEDDAYFKNTQKDIPGHPWDLKIAQARNVSGVGSSTVLTDKVSYVIDNSTLTKVWELKDQFLDGAPANLEVVDRRDQDGAQSYGEGAYTFIATKDGKVYTREMSNNYLGGKFLTEPYFVDDKGYKITKFGHSTYGLMNSPCYDEKNRRVLMANVWRADINHGGGMGDNTSVYRTRIVPVKKPYDVDAATVPIWDMPEGTKVLHLSQGNHMSHISGLNALYTIFYLNKEGSAYMADFAVSNPGINFNADYFAKLRWYNLTEKGVHFDENTIILTNATNRRRGAPSINILYANDREIKLIQRPDRYSYYLQNLQFGNILTFDSKITFMTYDWYDCSMLVVGCENGDIYFYDVYDTIRAPKLISKFNVGGKISSIKELGQPSSSQDYY